MNRLRIITNKRTFLIIFLAILLAACQPGLENSGVVVPSGQFLATETSAPTAASPTVAPTIEPTARPAPTVAQPVQVESTRPDAFILGQPGPYFPGKRRYELEGYKFGGIQQTFTVWYPALKTEGFKGTIAKDAPPDLSGGPYPLVVMSEMMGNTFATDLVSHGFVAAGVSNLGPSRQWGTWLVEFPRQILAMLDQIAASPPEGLEGVIDAENTGAMGYSFDGFDALMLSGARVDPAYFQERCTQGPAPGATADEKSVNQRVYDYFCALAPEWQAFSDLAGEQLAASDENLWQPLSDPRIRAVMPMATEGVWLFGEGGLAAVEKPVLMLCGTADGMETAYTQECAYTFEHLGSTDKGLVSFIDQPHTMIEDAEQNRRMDHFIAAFFGYHLQGKQEYADYLMPEFVDGQEGLHWGVYSGK